MWSLNQKVQCFYLLMLKSSVTLSNFPPLLRSLLEKTIAPPVCLLYRRFLQHVKVYTSMWMLHEFTWLAAARSDANKEFGLCIRSCGGSNSTTWKKT